MRYFGEISKNKMEKKVRCPKRVVIKRRSENVKTVHVLLPVCVELKHDIFFNILKNVVGRVSRSKLAEHYMDNAFKTGMIADEIIIQENEVSSSWKKDQSSEASVRQSQMLGYWSRAQCPGFTKIFFGENCKPRQENVVKIKSMCGTKTMTSDEVDKVISQKMECAIVELCISESTVTNLKQFVHVPINEIEVYGEVKITQQMKSCNIKDEYISKCWAALKHGEWFEDDSTQVGRILFIVDSQLLTRLVQRFL